MIQFSQHAIQKASLGIIWIAGDIGFRVMNVVRHYVYLFRKRSDNKVLCYEAPQGIAECIRFVCTIAMKPNGAVRTHDHHAVRNNCCNKPPGKIVKQEKEKERKEAKSHQPTGH